MLPTSGVRKSVFSIHARPVNGRLSLAARKLHLALCREAGRQYKALPESTRQAIEHGLREHVATLRRGERPTQVEVLQQPRFFAGLRELAAATGYDEARARNLWDPLRELQATTVEFNFLRQRAAPSERDLFPDEMQVIASLTSSVVRAGRGLVSWGYDPLVFAVLVNPQTYAVLSLELVRNARTYAALALYENVKRFVAIGRAGPYAVRQWQELLSEDGRIPAWETAPEFRRKVKRVLAQLAAVEGCDIDIEMVNVRVGRDMQLAFQVRPRAQSQLMFGVPLPADPELALALERIGFSAEKTRSLLESEDHDYLRDHLRLLRERQARPDLAAVRDPCGWYCTALERDYRKEHDQAIAAQRERERKRRLTGEAQQIREEFARYRAEQTRAVFDHSPAEQQAAWRQQFATSEAHAKLAGLVGTKLASRAQDAAFWHWLEHQPDVLTAPEAVDIVTWQVWRRSHAAAETPPTAAAPD